MIFTPVVAHDEHMISFSRESRQINRLDFLIPVPSSADFIYVEKIIDTDRKNAITSEGDVMAGE